MSSVEQGFVHFVSAASRMVCVCVMNGEGEGIVGGRKELDQDCPPLSSGTGQVSCFPKELTHLHGSRLPCCAFLQGRCSAPISTFAWNVYSGCCFAFCGSRLPHSATLLVSNPLLLVASSCSFLCPKITD